MKEIQPCEIVNGVKYYDLFDMQEMVKTELGYDPRDCGKIFHPKTGNMKDWHKKKKYSEKDSEGKEYNCSQIWFKEYNNDIREGKWLDTPYYDFWHFQLDNCIDPETFSNDSYSSLFVGDLDDETIYAEEWQKVIHKKWNEMFNHISNDGWINIWASW